MHTVPARGQAAFTHPTLPQMPKAVTGNTRLEDRRELDESMGLYRRVRCPAVLLLWGFVLCSAHTL